MMFGNRLEFTLRLELKSDLRIGSGHAKEVGRLKRGDGDDTPELALVMRDHEGCPIIPATALKGALRGQAPLATSEADALLGERGEAEENKGAIARLWVDTAVATDVAPPGLEGLTKKDCVRDHAYVKTGVRLDRRTGSAEDKLLYNQEWVGGGSVFEGKATLFLDDAEEAVLLDRLARALAPLVRAPGLALGADTRHGAGRVLLSGLRCKRRTVDSASLALVDRDEPDLARKLRADAAGHGTEESPPIRLGLRTDGPFISMRDKTEEPGDGKEITRPLTRHCKPHLWPSSLLGALRARAAWLAEVERLRDDDRFAPGRAADLPADVPDKVILDPGEVADLSSVERLFGVAGWRGLLRIVRLEPSADASCVTARLTSVTIDRFTAGAMDKRLFTEEVFLDARFEADLVVESRGAVFEVENDRKLLDALVTDITNNGLELGHGASKGFGWFVVERLQ